MNSPSPRYRGPAMIMAGMGRCRSPLMRNCSTPASPIASWVKNTIEKNVHRRRRQIAAVRGLYSTPISQNAYAANPAACTQPAPGRERSASSIGR